MDDTGWLYDSRFNAPPDIPWSDFERRRTLVVNRLRAIDPAWGLAAAKRLHDVDDDLALYGSDGTAAPDRSQLHAWELWCLERPTPGMRGGRTALDYAWRSGDGLVNYLTGEPDRETARRIAVVTGTPMIRVWVAGRDGLPGSFRLLAVPVEDDPDRRADLRAAWLADGSLPPTRDAELERRYGYR